jgi:hypothetical protein
MHELPNIDQWTDKWMDKPMVGGMVIWTYGRWTDEMYSMEQKNLALSIVAF